MSIRIKNIILALALSLAVILFSICVGDVNREAIVGGDLQLNGYQFESYVKSDFLLGEDRLTIVDYANSIKNQAPSLFASAVQIQNSGSKDFELKVSGDDPIVDIVPKELFAKDCREMIVGREYGFVIDSFSAQGDAEYRRAIVMVFDFVNKTNISLSNDNIEIIVKPLFQQEYIYVDMKDTVCRINEYNKDKMTYDNYTFKCALAVDSAEAVVLPAPQYVKSEKTLKYMSVDKYALSDFVFAGSLYNEQHANPYNSGYDMLKDDGAFFVQSGYSYNGARLNDGVLDYSENDNEIVQFAMGDNLPSISGYDESEWLKQIDETKESINNEASHRTDYITRQKQIDVAGGMYKHAAIRFDTSFRNAYFIGVGGFMSADFTISRTDANGENWSTRFIRRLSFKAVESRNRQNIIKAQDSTDFKLGGDRARSFNTADGDALCYVLQNGKNVFEVTPEFDSYYKITTTADKPVAANVVDESGDIISQFVAMEDGEKVTIRLDMEKDKKYYIETYYVSKTASGEYRLKFEFDPPLVITE